MFCHHRSNGAAGCRCILHCSSKPLRGGIGLLTPTSLHFGQAKEIITARDETLQNAWQKTPERFVNGVPKAMSIPKAVWINTPKKVVAKKE